MENMQSALNFPTWPWAAGHFLMDRSVATTAEYTGHLTFTKSMWDFTWGIDQIQDPFSAL